MDEEITLLKSLFVDQYKIIKSLGSGSIASVYLAEDLRHHRKIAIKVLRPEMTATMASEQFLDEIKIAAALTHPHIVPVYDSGASGGIFYYVMPFIPGESLRERLDNKTHLDIDESLHIIRDIGSALHYAHAHKVVHRDIKPENILLEEGHALLTDFGIAHALSTASNQEISGTHWILGTPAYMSPEQAYGDHNIDHRSDLYSLGCVLFESLTGQPPFTGQNAQQVIAKMLTEDVPPLRISRPEVPYHISLSLRKMLSKNPEERFHTIDAFLESLDASTSEVMQSARKSIAVLPFTNLGGTDENEYLADGLTDEIINALSKIENLNVVSRTSVYAFKEKQLDIRAIGEQLNVSTVLEGSLQKSGEMLRVTGQLIDVANGYHLWSEQFHRKMKDVFTIQDEIAQKIVSALQILLTKQEQYKLSRTPVENVNAYQYYLRGRQYFHQTRKKSLEYAKEMFLKAIEIDPDYARAYAGIAESASQLYMYYPEKTEELEQASDASRRALELDPELSEVHAARGMTLWQQGDLEGSSTEFDQAIALDPKNFEAHYFYARSCFQTGQMAKAARLFNLASKIKDDYQASFFAAQSFAALDQKSEMEGAYLKSLQIVAKYMELNPDDPRAATMRAVSLCRLGQKEEGLKWAEQALAIDIEDAGVRYNVACLYALEGYPEKALDYLEEAVRKGFGNKDWFARDPDLESIRDHPRFVKLMQP